MHFISQDSVKFLQSPASPPDLSSSVCFPQVQFWPQRSLDRQPPLLWNPEMTLCVFPNPLSYCCSPAVCAHPHLIGSGLGPGVAGREVMGVFPSLILFFCLPSDLSPSPFTKKRKEKKKKNTNKISERNYTFGPGCLCLLCLAD